jgi:hypothetical protein
VKLVFRICVVLALLASVIGVSVGKSPSASAAPIGTLTFNGLANQDTAFSVTTSGACPTTPTLSTNFLIRVSGGNLPIVTPLANITGNTAGSTVGGITAGPFTAGASNTLRNFATAQGLSGGLGNGTYTVELVCRQAIQSASLGEFVGTFTLNQGVVVAPLDLRINGLTSQDTAFSVTTLAPCPTTPTLSTNFLIRVSGGNLPIVTPLANITGNTAGSTVGGITAGPFTAGASNTLRNFATAQGLSAGLGDGLYYIELVCRQAIQSAALRVFVGAFAIAGGIVTVLEPPVTPVTPTTVTVTSATPAAGAGNAPATFTATVTPSAATGTVQFTVDGVNLGAPVTVAGGVVTSPATGLLTAGTHVVVASFTGGSGYGNSTSAGFAYTVNIPAPPSTTNLVLSTAVTVYGSPVDATAVVTSTPIASAGTIVFQVNGANFGAPVPVSASGVATTTFNLPIGTYAVTAVFSGATIAGVAVGSSTSPAAPLQVLPGGDNFGDVQFIRTTVPPGTLLISTPYTEASPLDLGPMALNASATEYSSSAPFLGIQVTDSRPGNLPYTLSAIASPLTKFGVAAPSVNEVISAQNVGLTNVALTSTNSTPNSFLGGVAPGGSTSGRNFTGFQNPPAAHVQSTDVGTLGLGGTSKVVLHANNGLGVTVTSGTLTITAPGNTLDGLYTGTLTFTIIGS